MDAQPSYIQMCGGDAMPQLLQILARHRRMLAQVFLQEMLWKDNIIVFCFLFPVLLAQVFPQEMLWNDNILVFCFLFSVLLAQETGNASE